MISMRQLTYVSARLLEWWEVPAPGLESGADALVRPLAVARCDLDVVIAAGAYPTPGPFAFGHEMAAEVVEVGGAVAGFSPGDRVIVPFQISCGECANCRRGWTNTCLSEPPRAAYGLGTHPTRDYGGAFSDLVRVPYADAMLLPLPPALAPEAACGLGDNVADGYRTVAAGLERFPGEPVLVAGGLARSVGLYAVLAALALGSRRVVYADSHAHRLELASRAGAEAVAVDYGGGESLDHEFLITVDASATREGLAWVIRHTAPCGFCTGVYGPPKAELPLPSMYLRGITYEVSRVQSRVVLPQVLEHACSGGIDPLAPASPPLAFSQAAEVMLDPAPKLVFLRD